MAEKYKDYTIIVNADIDDASKLWNGRFRIMSDESIVVYESFSDPSSSEEQAKMIATSSAKRWVDQQ